MQRSGKIRLLLHCFARSACLWSGWPRRASLTRCTPARVTSGPSEFSYGKSSLWVKTRPEHTHLPPSQECCVSVCVWLSQKKSGIYHPSHFIRCVSVPGSADWRGVLQSTERRRQDESARDSLPWNVRAAFSFYLPTRLLISVSAANVADPVISQFKVTL